MSPSLGNLRVNKKLMAYTAAAMYGAAAGDAMIEGLLPGDPSFALAPAIGSLAIALLLVAFGPRLRRAALAPLGPIGVVLIAYALTVTTGAGDGAVLYMWPVLWTACFFGRRGAVAIVACVGVAHAATLLSLPAASSYPGRWVDVMISVSVVAVVVLTLVRRNEQLLTQLAGEARTDALTGLLNRRGFDERAAFEMAHARARARGALAGDDVAGLPVVHVSAGVLSAHAPASIEEMLQGADAALYRAKRAGRNRTAIAEPHGRVYAGSV